MTIAPVEAAPEPDTLGRRFALDGDAGFDAVFTALRGRVFAITLHVLGDPGLAEEAGQLTFLRLWRGRDRFDPARDLEAWVFGIARRAAIDVYRRERRRPPTVDTDQDFADETLTVERLWETWEVRRAVEALPADEAEVVRLAHFEQLTHVEIAAVLHVPVGTIKSRSHRAHKRLARSMSHLR